MEPVLVMAVNTLGNTCKYDIHHTYHTYDSYACPLQYATSTPVFLQLSQPKLNQTNLNEHLV